MGVLLDTCATLWLGFGDPLHPNALERIAGAALVGELFISPMTAWEIALLEARGRLELDIPPLDWFTRFVANLRVTQAPLGAEILVASQSLPGNFHKDPADRIIVATARALGVPVVTRDRLILSYADQGHVTAIAC